MWENGFPSSPPATSVSGQSDQLFLPPTFNFEDLGLVLQFTPHVHGAGEVTLELDTELKALTGQSVDEIPVIANRKLQSVVRLRPGEWAVIAGLLNSLASQNHQRDGGPIARPHPGSAGEA